MKNSITPRNHALFKKNDKSKGDTRYTSPVVCPTPYASAQSYYPGRYQASMDSYVGFVRPHQNGIADTWRGVFFFKPLQATPPYYKCIILCLQQTPYQRDEVDFMRTAIHLFMALYRASDVSATA